MLRLLVSLHLVDASPACVAVSVVCAVTLVVAGGSVGMELYRLTIRELTKSLDSQFVTTETINTIRADFGLNNPVQIACPKYKPAQVESQSIPKQPQPQIVRSTQSTYQMWFPSIVRWFTLLGTLAFLTWLKQAYPKHNLYHRCVQMKLLDRWDTQNTRQFL